MRHLIILSGNSLKNKAWGELIEAAFASQFDSHFLLPYDHWASGEATIDFTREEEKLRAHIASLPNDVGIILFAKSAGSLLALLAIHHQILTPTHCVFFGMPFDLAATELFKDNWDPISTFRVPAIAFHNQADPTTSYEYTKATLATYAPQVSLIITNEHDHWYGDISTYGDIITTFLEKNK